MGGGSLSSPHLFLPKQKKPKMNEFLLRKHLEHFLTKLLMRSVILSRSNVFFFIIFFFCVCTKNATCINYPAQCYKLDFHYNKIIQTRWGWYCMDGVRTPLWGSGGGERGVRFRPTSPTSPRKFKLLKRNAVDLDPPSSKQNYLHDTFLWKNFSGSAWP